jgi:CheY-like chemotaxis protein
MEYKSDNIPTIMGTAEKLIRILIAEDNILNQKIIEILIKRMGWSYKLVADGIEAVEECVHGNYDVILMDIDMPQMNGWEATIEIRRQKLTIPIIALTAYSEESFRKRSFEAGMNYFLSKPYNKEEIYDTIRKCVNAE